MKKSILLLFCMAGLPAFATTGIVPGTPYYMRNVANGKFLTAGGWWGTHAIVGESGLPVTFEAAGGANEFRAMTPAGYFQARDMYLDKPLDQSCVWTAETDGNGQFVFKYTVEGQEKAVGMDGDMYINDMAINAGDAAQQWELFTREELIQQLADADVDNPMNATFLFPGASIIPNSSENARWVRTDAGENALFELASAANNDDAWRFTRVYKSYNNQVEDGATTAYTITNSAEGLPAGAYVMTAYVVSDGASPVMTVNGLDVTYQRVGDGGTYSAIDFGTAVYEGRYKVSIPVNVTDGKLEVKFVKGADANPTALYFDNFDLLYIGNKGGDAYNVMYKNVKEAMTDAEAIATRLGLKGFNNSEVQDRWDNHRITGDGSEEVHMTYEALAAACKAQGVVPADMTYAILNPSFELGAWGWTFDTGGDTVVAENKDGKATEGGDGKYLYNTWDNAKGHAISQTISGLPSGTYTAAVKVSAPANSTVYIFANDSHQGVTIPADSNEGVFYPVEVRFELAPSQQLNLGVTGGDESGNFVADNGAWFRADNFTLTHMLQTSVTSVVADSDNAPVEYYNLQGMRITTPAAGQIYIVKQGSTVRKVAM